MTEGAKRNTVAAIALALGVAGGTQVSDNVIGLNDAERKELMELSRAPVDNPDYVKAWRYDAQRADSAAASGQPSAQALRSALVEVVAAVPSERTSLEGWKHFSRRAELAKKMADAVIAHMETRGP